MMIRWKKSALMALAAFALLVASRDVRAGSNLVQNGDFEQNGGLGQMAGGISYATDWTVGATVVNDITPSGTLPFDFIVNGQADSAGFPSVNTPALGTNIFVWGPANGVNNGFTSSPNGGYFFGSDGGYATAPISQDISGLTIGTQYTLSFQWAASQFTNYYGATTQSWDVSFGGESTSTTPFNLPSQGFSGWMDFSYTFTASATTQTLSFLAVGSPHGLPPFTLLDGVSLVSTSSVPEPTSLLMLGVSSLGLLGVGLRRRARAAKI